MNRCYSLWLLLIFTATSAAQPISISDSPLRRMPPVSRRPLSPGNARFVDVKLGSDEGTGLENHPWRSLAHAVKQLRPGDTLYLRAGVYHEQLYLSLQGRADAPIIIRGYPGEEAIIDGSIAEFANSPEKCWEPCPGGVEGEYRSSKPWPNLRDVIGYDAPSKVGLQTYWHRKDLQATSEIITGGGKEATDKDIDPVYLGPGLWYDRETGYIHCRLAQTHLPAELGLTNFQGTTGDPREMNFLIAPYRSTPLFFDQAEHVVLQDLTIRGGGYVTVLMEQAQHITLDYVTIFAGTYGIRALGTSHLRLTNCGVHGSLAPWTFRSDASKRDYPGRPHRNISRLNTHALIEADAGRESSVWAYPLNDHWKISHCFFTDSHDGVYLGAINVDFHHNVFENLQDDGIYLSPMYQRHKLDGKDPQILIHHNHFRALLTALAFGGNEPNTHDQIFVYRNVFNLREKVMAGRMSENNPKPTLTTGKLIGDHGSPPWSTLTFAHNTVIAGGNRDALMSAGSGATPERPKRVFNNLFLHTDRLPPYLVPAVGANLISDGNLFWSPSADEKTAAAFFKKWQASPAFAENKKLYEAVSESHSLVADPQLDVANPLFHSYELSVGNAAIDAGADVKFEGFDPTDKSDADRPDIGAIPAGGKMFKVGRFEVRK
ncbi:right-handed parallel beta-helix repeat-containing protein [Anatilimnocola floriformis]|uniref:right-handed parallel beta-helix repeat-containing protein n=1 Tax=Anatilimnocola floriformis TaxID=2948575 RepID=UPI0020C2FC3B|nr:right-handed parallel beta-helix repeat-containing protein [Anatilimnocola floriformis]